MRPNTNNLRLTKGHGESGEHATARGVLRPEVRAAATVMSYMISGVDTELNAMVDELSGQCRSVECGNLSRIEHMLTAQLHSLDALFNKLAQCAALNRGEYLGATETYLKLALKAQSQSRATAEALANIKNPPVVFTKQANFANGPQQINNGDVVSVARVENEKPPIELLEHDHGKRLDTRTASKAGRGNQAMAAVAHVHRSTQRRRQVRLQR